MATLGFLPKGITNYRQDGTTWTMKVSIPSDDQGYFGRLCPACNAFFKVRVDEFRAAPDDLQLYCCYCGHRAGPDDFMSSDQKKRAISAAKAAALAKIQGMLAEALPRGTSHRGLVSVSWEFKPGTPPSLHTYIEEQVRRTVTCDRCGRGSAVYGAATFCPYCGPRRISDRILDEIAAQRRTLALVDHLPDSVREDARVAGVFDGAAADSIENVVTLFEHFCRETFNELVAPALDILKRERPNVFQSLDDSNRVFRTHTQLTLHKLVDRQTWERMHVAFAKRHVLTHRNGLVDKRYLDSVPISSLKVGQRLLISRTEAEQALDDLQALVSGVASTRRQV
jgi:hypothetical protein